VVGTWRRSQVLGPLSAERDVSLRRCLSPGPNSLCEPVLVVGDVDEIVHSGLPDEFPDVIDHRLVADHERLAVIGKGDLGRVEVPFLRQAPDCVHTRFLGSDDRRLCSGSAAQEGERSRIASHDQAAPTAAMATAPVTSGESKLHCD
jgi:hypothetical protein